MILTGKKGSRPRVAWVRLWRSHLQASAVEHRLRLVGRFLHLLFYRFSEDGGLHHTATLTYTTLLSVVPLMTVTLALFAAFPVSERVVGEVQDFIFKNFVPASGEVIHEYLNEFSRKASRLTGAGAVFLLAVAVLMMSNIERAFNTIWQVERGRPPLARFLVYWASLTLAPLLIGSSVAVTSYLVSIPLFHNAAESLGSVRPLMFRLLPMLASSLAFTLVYLVVPNRSVPWRHALAGGLLAGLLFEGSKRAFAFYVTSFPTYEAIYGAMAVVPIFLIWVYLSWLVTLLGAEFTYCLGIFREDWHPDRPAAATDLLLAYRVLGYLWTAQQDGHGLEVETLLGREPGLSEAELEKLLLRLRKARLLVVTENDEWVLARDLHDLTLFDLYRSARFVLPDPECGLEPELEDSLGKVEQDLQEVLRVPLAQLYRLRAQGSTTR